MSSPITIIRYDGPAVAEHSMDAADLAPALAALSNLVEATSRQLYGDQSSTKVLVQARAEPACFELQIEIVQLLAHHVGALFEDQLRARAIEIALTIGLLGAAGLFELHKWLAQQSVPRDLLRIENANGSTIIVNPQNNGDINVTNNTFNVFTAPGVSDQVKEVVRPLTKDGYERLEFESDGEVVGGFSTKDGFDMCAYDPDLPDIAAGIKVSTTRAKVKVKKPDLIGDSMWSVVHDKTIDVRMEDQEWLGRFHAAEIAVPAGSHLDVDLRTEIRLDAREDPVGDPKFYIPKVHAVIPPRKLFG